MTLEDLSEKYGMSKDDLIAYASTHLKNFRRRSIREHEKIPGSALRQLDWLLANRELNDQVIEEIKKDEESPKKEIDNDWAHDPTEDEPDDTEVAPPPIEPEPIKEKQPKRVPMKSKPKTDEKKPHTLSIDAESVWEKEKAEMLKQMEAMQQELADLRHSNLKMQSGAAEKQAELLSKAIQERQLAEERIALMRQDAESIKHLSNIRIQELEERNTSLDEEVKKARIDLANVTKELIEAQHVLQETRDNANTQGAEQKLQLLDAQHRQDELFKIIHEKELALAEERDKTREIIEKYNNGLMRMGEIICKIDKARKKMREISSDFDDIYINSDAEELNKITEAAASEPETMIEEKKPKQIEAQEMKQQEKHPIEQPEERLKEQAAPNPETMKVLGKPLHEIYPEKRPQEQASKPGFWRRVASFF